MTQTRQQGILETIANLERWFDINGLRHPSVIHLTDKATGMAFAYLVARETGMEAHFRPNISYLDIRGIRFVWPMPEMP